MVDGGKKARLAALRQQLAALENGEKAPVVLPFGITAIDAGLPSGGLALGALHEVASAETESEDGAVAAAFLAGIVARLSPERPVLWCLRHGDLYPPGLALYGLAPQRLILARAPDDQEILWAMEEGLRSPALAAVIGEVKTLSAPASRRLQLAAETSGVTGFILRRGNTAAATSSAVTRWRVAALLGSLASGEPGMGRPRWRLELLRCRGGMLGAWEIEAWCAATQDAEAGDATDHVSFSAAMADRPAVSERRAAG
jgi:protein ImuA